MRIVTVTALDDEGLRPYQTLRRPLEHQQEGIFVAEGEKVVRRLLDSNIVVRSVLLTPEWLEVCRPALETKQAEIVVYVAPKALLESVVGFHLHQGIMAVASIPRPSTLEEALAATRPRLFVAVDGLTNAENLGVLVRNCAAFGVDALIVGETSSSPYLRRAVRNSMGTVFNLPVVHVNNLVGALEELRSIHGLRVLGAHPRADHEIPASAFLKADCCIVFGSEGEGIAPRVLAVCDELLAIPMKSGVDSLNVASASAVVLYEVSRQRGKQKKDGPSFEAAAGY
jgi:tRNA G18 (ribose-2'-O)-methylase SpoU